MAKKTQKKSRSAWSAEMKNILAGLGILFLCVLVFFGSKDSKVGEILFDSLEMLYGDYYKFIFSGYVILSVGIIVGKLHWNSIRVIGILLYSISLATLIAAFTPYASHGILDFSGIFTEWIGKIPMGVLFFGMFLFSLFLMLRIHYRHVVTAVHSTLPSIQSLRSTVQQIKEEVSSGSKSSAGNDGKAISPLGQSGKFSQSTLEARKKELEKELEIARKERELERKEAEKKLQEAQSSRHIPITEKSNSLLGKMGGLFGVGNDDEDSENQESSNGNTPSKSGMKSFSVSIGGSQGGSQSGGNSGTSTNSKNSSDANPSSQKQIDFGVWETPPTSLLTIVKSGTAVSQAEVNQKSKEIETTLLQFRIGVEMKGEKVGPTVVQYRLQPNEGVKLSKIENLKKDLTLALKAKSIRIQAPIPGLGLVGIEVPNEKREMIGIREVLEHPNFANSKAALPIVVGKDINGDYIVGDMTKMPHLLVAGQTASGKSVGLNGFLMSFLFKYSPSQLRMILIDPKRVELTVYNGIPHLLTPVITEPDKALNSLKWSVAEMLRRYDVLNVAKVRNLAEYNVKVGKKDKMPFIVIVIDELADLMMSGNKKEVENAIARIAQMARAVGMHLIVATQRPSVDVITGLIKANIPSRVAFTVASLIDSRTILDRMGAEDLLGNGDLLYSPAGSMSPERIQGVYVSTEEVESVVNFVKRTIDPDMLEDIYDASIVEGDRGDRGNWEGAGGTGGGESYDEDPKIIEEAISFVRSSGKASTSMLQRKMKLGYARAARVMDILEDMGIVGPADGSKPREVIG